MRADMAPAEAEHLTLSLHRCPELSAQLCAEMLFHNAVNPQLQAGCSISIWPRISLKCLPCRINSLVSASKVPEIPIDEFAADLCLGDVDEVLLGISRAIT